METGVYLPGLLAGFALPFIAAFACAVIYVPWLLFRRLVDA